MNITKNDATGLEKLSVWIEQTLKNLHKTSLGDFLDPNEDPVVQIKIRHATVNAIIDTLDSVTRKIRDIKEE